MSEAKCSCQFCNGHISFPAEMAGQMYACPHCGLETKLFIPNITKAPANSPPKNVSVEIKRGANPLGIASLVLGISACVFCWIPFLGLLAIPLAAIGLLLAVIGITSVVVGKKSSLAFPSSGAVVCIVAILVALFVTGGISTLIAKHEIQSNSTNQKTESSSGEEGWSKSSVVQQGDFQIQIEPISKEIFYPNNPSRIATPNDGFFTIKLSNLSKTRKIDFSTWRGKKFSTARDYATLTDDNGNVYKLDSESTGGQNNGREDETSIYPNSDYEEFLSFETPVQNRKWLHLELPAENFGGSGMIRFEIPASSSPATVQSSP
jgi:membrane protein implicated in regulation of membrane protease activity